MYSCQMAATLSRKFFLNCCNISRTLLSNVRRLMYAEVSILCFRKENRYVPYQIRECSVAICTPTLMTENIYHFLTAVVTGIPLSGLLCYYIYRIFRQI